MHFFRLFRCTRAQVHKVHFVHFFRIFRYTRAKVHKMPQKCTKCTFFFKNFSLRGKKRHPKSAQNAKKDTQKFKNSLRGKKTPQKCTRYILCTFIDFLAILVQKCTKCFKSAQSALFSKNVRCAAKNTPQKCTNIRKKLTKSAL